MLRHEDRSLIPSQSAAKVRVTPEELAAAITALQIRKEGQPGTVAIGDAVDELGLDLTPEEVLAEVQARRQATPQRARQQRGRSFVLALGLAGVLLGLTVEGNSLLQIRNYKHAKPVSVGNTASQPSNAPKWITLEPNLVVDAPTDKDGVPGDHFDKIELLSEVGDDQPFYCYYDYDSGSFYSYSSQDGPAWSWTLIKHDGQVYVRGGMPRMSAQALRKDGAYVTWDSDSGVPVTLPLGGFQVIPGPSNEQTGFHAVNIHLDKHAYEKW